MSKFQRITTDLTLTVKQMIEFYFVRRKIDSGFMKIKQEVGIIDFQCRKPNTVKNHLDLCYD
ncbi:MAG: hypothetical protein WCI51_02415 [Lentisphaerota bacterium]